MIVSDVRTIIDPMHSLLLGTPKHLFNKQWVNSGLLNKTELEKIQDIVSNCTVPSSVRAMIWLLAF